MDYKALLERLAALSAAYKAQFDNPPEISLEWSIQDNILYLDGIRLCPVAAIDTAGETEWAQGMCLQLIDGRLDIIVDWPFGESKARIGSVLVSRYIYQADEGDKYISLTLETANADTMATLHYSL